MKKIIILYLMMSVIQIIIITAVINKYWCRKDAGELINVDSVINKIQIDSIELVIKRKDSVIFKIKEYELKEIEKANSLNNDDAVVLFKRLVSE